MVAVRVIAERPAVNNVAVTASDTDVAAVDVTENVEPAYAAGVEAASITELVNDAVTAGEVAGDLGPSIEPRVKFFENPGAIVAPEVPVH